MIPPMITMVSSWASHDHHMWSFVSFVRSTTMDRWKDSEVEKMTVGGNSRAKDFLDSQPDIYTGISFSEKYNSIAAALYRDKVVLCLVKGQHQHKSFLVDHGSMREQTMEHRRFSCQAPPARRGDVAEYLVLRQEWWGAWSAGCTRFQQV